MSGTPITGQECYLYYNSGSNGSPDWQEIDNARDVADADAREKVDASARFSDRKRYIPGQSDGPVTFDYVYIKGETDSKFAFLKAAYDAKTPVQFAMADGPIETAGTVYHKDYYCLFQFAPTQELNGVVRYSVEIAPTVVKDSGAIIEDSYETVS